MPRLIQQRYSVMRLLNFSTVVITFSSSMWLTPEEHRDAIYTALVCWEIVQKPRPPKCKLHCACLQALSVVSTPVKLGMRCLTSISKSLGILILDYVEWLLPGGPTFNKNHTIEGVLMPHVDKLTLPTSSSLASSIRVIVCMKCLK